MNRNETVWSNTERDRHFLIPDADELPAGDYELRTVVGRQRHTTEEAAAPYEVSQEEAREWLKSQLGGVLDEAKTKITGFIEKARQASRARTEAALGEMPPVERQRQAETLEAVAAGLERAAAKGGERLRELARKMRVGEEEPEKEPRSGREE